MRGHPCHLQSSSSCKAKVRVGGELLLGTAILVPSNRESGVIRELLLGTVIMVPSEMQATEQHDEGKEKVLVQFPSTGGMTIFLAPRDRRGERNYLVQSPSTVGGLSTTLHMRQTREKDLVHFLTTGGVNAGKSMSLVCQMIYC